MNITVKKTYELSESQQYGILDLFNAVFKKERSIEHFRSQFFNTVLEYSYHVLLYDDGSTISGCCSYTPSYYIIEDKKHLCALSVDTMISASLRGRGYFKEMLSSGIDYMRNDGVAFIINFPNDISYPRYIKSELRRDIGKLATYALPYRIGAVKPKLKAFNWLSAASVNFFLFLTSPFAASKIHRFPIEKDLLSYNRIRYTQPNGGYLQRSENGGFVYKIMEYENIRTAFLIDVFEKSAKNFNTALKYMVKNHNKEFDILLYVGVVPFRFSGLIKVPKAFSPKNFNFVGKLLRKDAVKTDLFFNLSNWDINLSNYDLI
ncbi:MAG: GNAT family N-acetyltransferase [Chitinispirillales bacterium]|jgi:hypothetical protein|nr:GNAT family N-acetyltransferase [Chitinispirillales bacterium]